MERAKNEFYKDRQHYKSFTKWPLAVLPDDLASSKIMKKTAKEHCVDLVQYYSNFDIKSQIF